MKLELIINPKIGVTKSYKISVDRVEKLTKILLKMWFGILEWNLEKITS